ncbi:hypothetical protein KI387_016809, partial [Taxus chinensis]
MGMAAVVEVFLVAASFGRLLTASAEDSGVISCPLNRRPYAVGINYGRVADNLPPPSVAVDLIQQLKAGYVKIYDADAEVISAFSDTGLPLVITVRNEDISNISSSPLIADQWIQTNVLRHYPSVLICTIMVGNEVLSSANAIAIAHLLVPAMTNIQSALVDHNLGDAIKVTTSLAMDVFGTTYPPSAGAFREEVVELVMQPMLDLIARTNSYVFLDVYPFFAWGANTDSDISLDYALLNNPAAITVDDQGLGYSNMLDSQVDAAVAAMEKLGHPDVALVISETGWPSKGDDGQRGATLGNAALYNQNLVRKALANPPAGTPRRPNTLIPVFIFSLFNENQKPGPSTERNWGLFYPDGTPIYPMVLSTEPSTSSPVSRISTAPSKEYWCVALASEEGKVQAALDYACAAGGDCSAIASPNQPCFFPDTLLSHASYAFNSYWQRTKAFGATCNFDGTATLTTSDP